MKIVKRKNKASAARGTTGTAFYIFFGIIYMGLIWGLHQYAPFYHKSNDQWNDRAFSQPLEGELYPDNIILIDIDTWPYYKDNRDEARLARDKLVKGMIDIIDLLNRDPKKKPPFIGIDMTFKSYANNELMDQLFTRILDTKNIFLAVEFDRENRVLTFPRNYFWDKITREIEKIKKRLMVINLEKYRDEPVRRYRTFFKAAYDSSGLEFGFPSMSTVIARMVSRYYFWDPRCGPSWKNTNTLELANRVSRFRFRYLIRDIKEDFRKYNVFSMREAEKELEKPGGKWDIAKSIVIFGRVDPDPGGRDRFSICAIIKKDNIEREATLPGVMIHINAAWSILLRENIRPMATWKVLVYLIVLLVVLVLLHMVIEAVVARWKPGMSHLYAEIFLFFAMGFFVIFLDGLFGEPGSYSLEVPMFTFYMFVVKFYPVLGVYKWVYRRVVSSETKEETKNAKG